MSAAGSAHGSDMGAVLLALWDACGREVPMRDLERSAGGSLARAQAALEASAARGCRIERSPGGVSLATTGFECWGELMVTLARRGGKRLGRRVQALAETASTNDTAWEAAGAADGDGLVVVADHQTAGRGRLGRAWLAKPGQSVLMSVVLYGMAAETLDRLTLLAGLATAEGLERAVEAGGGGGALKCGRIGIQWPNDLLAGGRKLAGILVETRRVEAPGGRKGRIDAVLVGIGINVAQGPADFPPELAGRAISLFEASGVLLDRLRIVQSVLARLEDHLAEAGGEGESWLGRWKERCDMLGRRVTVRSGERVITGRVVDVAPLQGLIVRDARGATHVLPARTSTLR
jgi:BirA family transcriptional regulator, biotin operon repressor / biotin---[acetyl-CoA-carboxylase] ligase